MLAHVYVAILTNIFQFAKSTVFIIILNYFDTIFRQTIFCDFSTLRWFR